MKQLLIDHTPFNVAKLTLTEAKATGNGRMRVKGKLQEAEQKNGNGRVYPMEVLRREVEKYIDGPIKSNTAMGELELLNTPSGKIAQEIISAGIPLGISSRGMGSVKQIGESVEVQDDFELVCWDLVSLPSTPDAYMRLSEGKQTSSTPSKDYRKINSLITEIICTHTGVCALC